ncbi:FIST N-terminal domain-containing protein [Dongia sp.]|uniref:FIST signal transduction protein n=1 Tax=Dongia sp. TaxID=1977262 RepID=UPI0035AE7F4F
MSGTFASAHASGAHWADITRSCLAQLGPVGRENAQGSAALGFVYVTDHLANDMEAIVDRLRLATGIENWVGTVGIAIAGQTARAPAEEYIDEPAVSLMVGHFPPDGFRLLEPEPGGMGSRLRALKPWRQARHPAVALVHADPRNPQLPNLMQQLSDEAGLYLLGGLSSSRGALPQVAGRVGENGLSGALFAGEVSMVTGLSQGCSPIGPSHVITRAEDNIVMEIDGRPALDVFCEEIGEVLARDLRKVAGFIFAALPIAGCDTGDYLVRNLTGIDSGKGWISIAAEVAPGDTILFTRRDRSTALADLERMLERLKQRIDRPVRGGVYVSCIARGPNLFGLDATETRLIAQHLGQFPLTGFFANGEISHDRIYAYTGVLTLFL